MLLRKKIEYEVREKPTLNTWMQGGLDFIMLQYLNIDGIRTIGSVLGQSIALDYYVRQVSNPINIHVSPICWCYSIGYILSSSVCAISG